VSSGEPHDAHIDGADPASELPVDVTMSVVDQDADAIGLGDDEVLDEQPAKRQRLDEVDDVDDVDDVDEVDEPPNDEEAVLALAADGLPDPDDQYDTQ
jgi:hypothetical protein